jgi:large subunit ribosomal protein L7A
MRGVPRVVGAKETKKALQKGRAVAVYLAADAEERVTGPLRQLARETGVETIDVPTMAELGRICGIEVGAAAAAVLKEEG